MRFNAFVSYVLLLYCTCLTIILLNIKLGIRPRNEAVFDNLDNSWLAAPHYDSTNSSFLQLNIGVANDRLMHETPRNIVFSDNASDFEIVESFPDSFPLSGGLSRPIPRHRIGKIPPGKNIICGISSIKREGTDYLLDTIDSLFAHMREEEKLVFAIVVFLAEEDDEDFVVAKFKEVELKYRKEINDGMLEVIAPSPAYYPDDWLKVLRPSFGDSVDRVKWRSKQNLDQMFLMMYAFHLEPKYYLMLEDDVIARQGFVTAMMIATKQAKVEDWFYMSFCRLGAIGKLFQRKTLPSYTAFIQTFWNAKPLDWLQIDFVRTKVCSYDEDLKKCQARLNKYTPQFSPSQFQHVGKVSSLKGKIQKLRDMGFRPA